MDNACGDQSLEHFLHLLQNRGKGYLPRMETVSETDGKRRLELARQAFKNFDVQCFWSWNPNAEITEETIPRIAKQLRLHGGRRGYLIAAELCRYGILNEKCCE